MLSSSASFSIGCSYECLMHSKTFSIALEQTMTQISPRAVCSLPSEWHASLMEANSKIKVQERNIIKSKCATGRVTKNPRPTNITVAKLLSKHISHQEKLHILKIKICCIRSFQSIIKRYNFKRKNPTREENQRKGRQLFSFRSETLTSSL